MVVGIFKARLQGIVVNVCNRTLGFHLFHSHCLKLQVSHCTCGVLSQCLVNAQSDFLPLDHFPIYEMCLQDFFCNRHSHNSNRSLFLSLTRFFCIAPCIFQKYSKISASTAFSTTAYKLWCPFHCVTTLTILKAFFIVPHSETIFQHYFFYQRIFLQTSSLISAVAKAFWAVVPKCPARYS